MEIVKYEKPEVPEEWEYKKSVKKVKGFIYKWKNLSEEIARELWIAREVLSKEGRPKTGTKVPVLSWSKYCEDIGSQKRIVNRWLKKWYRSEYDEIESPDLPDDKYRVIYVDPPWKYSDGLMESYGSVKYHYPQMSIEELCELPIGDLVWKNAVLFLWVTAPLLEECFEVIRSWGFKYKTNIVWDKDSHNFGHYTSVRHEHLLICTKGSCTPDIDEKIGSVVKVKRSKKHSQKPEEFRDLIDKLYPNGKRIELFAREKVNGWDSWGRDEGI